MRVLRQAKETGSVPGGRGVGGGRRAACTFVLPRLKTWGVGRLGEGVIRWRHADYYGKGPRWYDQG